MESKTVRKLPRACLCVLLSIVLVCGLLPVFSPSDVAYADETADETATSAEESKDSVIVVYEDEALDLTEEVAATADEAADATDDAVDESSDETSDEPQTLEDLGIVEQEELATTTSDYGTVALAQLSDDISVDEAIEVLEETPGVAYAQPNYSYSLLATTSDPYCVSSADASENQQYLFDSTVVDAWDFAQTAGSVTVAVLDTGCNLNHSDLAGTVDSAHAYDVTSDALLSECGVANGGDADGHGTLVAGVIAAQANNGEGIAGASYNANVLPVKVFNDDNVCTSADLIAAYDYLNNLITTGAVSNLRAVNISLGYYADGEDDADKALHEAIANMLNDHDVLTICAGGNGTSSGNANTTTLYPSDFSECLSVTALDEDGANASFADYNSEKDLSAPGVNILTTSSDGGYATATGSSMSAPLVAGAAALLWAADSSLSSSQVVSTLESTAKKVTGNAHAESGSAGALDAQAAVADALGVLLDDGFAEEDEATADDEAAETTNDATEDENATNESDETSDEFAQEVVSEDSALDAATENSDGSVTVVTEDGETITLDADDPELASDADENARMGSSLDDSSSSNIGTLASSQCTWTKSGSTWSTTLGGSKMTVTNAKYFGVDVSTHDGKIDWAKAKKAGVEYAIIRCGYGMDYTSQDDSQFYNNVKGCLDNNIPFGIYLYSYADSTSRASSEADHVIRLLKSIKSKYGVTASSLAYPVYYDLEETSLEKTSNRTLLANIATKFCNKIKDAGYTVGVYANKNWFDNYLTNSCFNNWTRWVAQYPSKGTTNAKTSYTGSYDMWQCMSNGSVNGIGTNVDIDFCYTTKFASKQVTGMSIDMSSRTALTVSWNKTTGATGYRVGFKYTTGSNTDWKYYTTTSTSYKISGISTKRQIAVKVQPYFTEDGTKTYGNWCSTTYRYTDKVSNLSSTMNYSKKTIKLKWSKYKASTGTVSYKIQYRKAGGSWTTKTTSSTSYTIKNLSSKASYQIRVYPVVKINGNSGTGVCSTVYRNMGKTSGLSTSYNSSTKKLKISWSKYSPSKGSVKYRVQYRKSSSSSWTSKTTSSRSYTISVTAGKAYQIRVTPLVTIDGKQFTATYGSANRIMAYANPSVSRKGRNMTVKVSSLSGASGYQIKYGRSSTFAASKSSTKKGKSRTIKLVGLRSSTARYYVKSRAYKKINGVTYYTPYSTVKKC